MIETIYTGNAPGAIGPYSQAKICGNILFTSGQIAINPSSNSVEEGTVEGQTVQVCENLVAILTAAGTTMENVIKTTCFLADMKDFAAFNEIYGKYFVSKPARSCVAAKELPKGVLVEVELIAEIQL